MISRLTGQSKFNVLQIFQVTLFLIDNLRIKIKMSLYPEGNFV